MVNKGFYYLSEEQKTLILMGSTYNYGKEKTKKLSPDHNKSSNYWNNTNNDKYLPM